MKKHISILEKLLGKNYQLIDGTNDIFELDLALWEYEVLSKQELIDRSAYFKTVDGNETIHYRTCIVQNLDEVYKNSSFRTKVFFKKGKFSTGYATHSLFPYRGKFHPQLIRALINIIGLKPGDTILDPMAGSSTVAVEANLLGIDAISVDLNPFCGLIGKVKTFSLDLDLEIFDSVLKLRKEIFHNLDYEKISKNFFIENNDQMNSYYEIILLAYLDAMGFAKRTNSTIENLFSRVLDRYILTIRKFIYAKKEVGIRIGKSKIINDDIINLPLKDNEVDAIITSPPYSFAIDYIKNDLSQLEYLDVDVDSIRNGMIGLQGRGINNKLELYFDKINISLSEMKRVCKKNGSIVIIIGTNDIQTKGVRLEKKVKELAVKQGLKFEFELKKPIRGLQNTMSDESIIFLSKQ